MMNRNKLLRLANEWTRTAKNDLRNKVRNFMNDMNTTEEELAYALGISEGELDQILHGNCNVSVDTFAKILIGAGLTLDVVPIEATPFRSYDQMPLPPQNFHPRMPHHMPPPMPPMPPVHDEYDDWDNEEELEDPAPQQRPSYEQRHQRTYVDPRQNTSRRRQEENGWHDVDEYDDDEPIVETPQRQESPKFREMSTDKLKEIIENKLWDSEINLQSASRMELIRFLENKDRAFQRVRDRRERRQNEEVNNYREGLRESVERRRRFNS